MRIHQFSPAHTTAGRITAWQPCPDSEKAYAATTFDVREPSINQSAHLAGVAPSDDAAPWIGFSCRLDDATPQSVSTALARYLDRHESLRSGFVRMTDGGLARRTLPPGVVRFAPVDLDESSSAATAFEVARAHLARSTQRFSWPAAAFVTIDDGTSTTLIAAFDHCTFDGYSAYLSVAELVDLHADSPRAASYVDFGVTERAGCERDDLGPGLDVWRAALDDERRLPALPSATGVARGAEHPHTVVSHPIASRAESRDFIASLKAGGTPVGVGFIALLVHAVMLQESSTRLTAMMSTHNRATPELARAIGWFAGVVPMTVDAPPGADLADVTRATATAWHRSTPGGAVPLPVAAQRLDADLQPSFVLSYINGTRCPGADDWERSRANVLLGPVAPGAQVHAWISCLPDGTYLEIRHPDTPQCGAWVDRLALSMRAEMLTAAPSALPATRGA